MQRVVALFMLVLLCSGFTPCADELLEDCCQEESSQAHQQEAEDHEEEGDDCSPFCACACCQVPIVSLTPIVATSPSQITADFTFIPIEQGLNPNFDIWQPPKV